MRLFHFIFFSLGLPLILQGTVSNNVRMITPRAITILTTVTTYIPPFQDSSSKEPTTIEVSAKNDKTFLLDGMVLCKGFSMIDKNSSQDGSKAILETVIIKNFNIDYNLIKSILKF